MTIKEAVFKAEDLTIKTWTLASMVQAVNEALYRGGFSAEAYEGAMFQLVQAAAAIRDETQEAIDDLFAALYDARPEQE